MPDETAHQKAERQQRLSHAMGVMFLQDKVDKLEEDVSKITYPRGMHKVRSAPAHDPFSSYPQYDTVGQGRTQPRAVTGPNPSLISDTSADPSSRVARKVATSIRLVDASVLIFSLRSVHNWSRDQSTCVVIPLEAINTLDLLKKGDEPINLAARKATRWLEDKISISTQDGDLMLTEPAPGIFAQKEHFRAASAQIAKARQTRLQHAAQSDLASDGDGVEGGLDLDVASTSKDAFSATEAPRYLRELLSVCLYCQQNASPACDFAVAIAYPPHHLQEKMLEAQLATTEKPSYLNRTDGRATEAWLDAYCIPMEVVATSKTWTGEKPSSRFRGEITGEHHSIGSSDDVLGGSGQGYKGQQRRKGSPTPSTSSSTGSFRSELSGLSMLSSHRSPRHRQESRFAGGTASGPHRSVRCMSTQATNPATEASTCSLGSEPAEAQPDSDEEGPIIARPSSAASSHTSFVSSLTTSTQDDWSSQTSASYSSHCGARISRHGPSPSPTPTSSVMDLGSTYSDGSSAASPRLTSRTLHKTKSGAEKMEEYLRRLEAGANASANANANAGGGGGGGGGGADRRTATSTPTPGAQRSG